MRIFVSSSFEDLHDYRAAAIRVLQQLGHRVEAMENMVAGAEQPLHKVLAMVDASEVYVGLFAWRYGYVPRHGKPPVVRGAERHQTSITHYEYLRAVERKLPVLAFLLDPKAPWPPSLVDGFDLSRPGAAASNTRISELRAALQRDHVVSWFSTPAELEARVATAVTMAGLRKLIDLTPAVELPGGAGFDYVSDSGGYSIANAVGTAESRQCVFRIDLAGPWWSTRLYLIAALAERLTQVRRVLVVRSRPPVDGKPCAAFVGQIATATIIATIEPQLAQLGAFKRWLLSETLTQPSLKDAARHCMIKGWMPAFGGPGSSEMNALDAEKRAKVDLDSDLLLRWFGDSMLQQPVEIADLQRVSETDLLRVLDYPSPFVPVLSRRVHESDPALGQIDVVDRVRLNARLAYRYLSESRER